MPDLDHNIYILASSYRVQMPGEECSGTGQNVLGSAELMGENSGAGT
jgi:hypothetical protein